MSYQAHPTVNEAVLEALIKGTQPPYSFKNGVFATLITKDTPVLNALATLITSPHLSTFEKDIVKAVREQFLAHPNQDAPFFVRPIEAFIASPLTHALGELVGVFRDDATERGVEELDPFKDKEKEFDGTCKLFVCLVNRSS
jgi:hypothetical protein